MKFANHHKFIKFRRNQTLIVIIVKWKYHRHITNIFELIYPILLLSLRKHSQSLDENKKKNIYLFSSSKEPSVKHSFPPWSELNSHSDTEPIFLKIAKASSSNFSSRIETRNDSPCIYSRRVYSHLFPVSMGSHGHLPPRDAT